MEANKKSLSGAEPGRVTRKGGEGVTGETARTVDKRRGLDDDGERPTGESSRAVAFIRDELHAAWEHARVNGAGLRWGKVTIAVQAKDDRRT